MVRISLGRRPGHVALRCVAGRAQPAKLAVGYLGARRRTPTVAMARPASATSGPATAQKVTPDMTLPPM